MSHVSYVLEHKSDLLIMRSYMIARNAEQRKFLTEEQSIFETDEKVQMLGHSHHPLPQLNVAEGESNKKEKAPSREQMCVRITTLYHGHRTGGTEDERY